MKKFLLLFLTSMLLMSCEFTTIEKNYIEQNNWKIIDLQVNAADWQYTGEADNNFHFASFEIPEINDFVYNNGLVTVYMEIKNPDNSYTQMPLPNVRHYEEFDDEHNQIQYTETIDYEYSIGTLSLFVTSSDFFEKNPGNRHFILKLIW